MIVMIEVVRLMFRRSAVAMTLARLSSQLVRLDNPKRVMKSRIHSAVLMCTLAAGLLFARLTSLACTHCVTGRIDGKSDDPYEARMSRQKPDEMLEVASRSKTSIRSGKER